MTHLRLLRKANQAHVVQTIKPKSIMRKFKVVLVCTGNRCRSPVAEAILRRYAQELPIEVESVGLLDLGPAPVLPEVFDIGSKLGLDLAQHRARPMMSVDLTDADLLLGLEWGHVAASVVEGKAVYERSFTLKEMVNLLEEMDVRPSPSHPLDGARKTVAAAHRLRSKRSAFKAGADIRDPFGGSKYDYIEMFRKVENSCERLVSSLFGPSLRNNVSSLSASQAMEG